MSWNLLHMARLLKDAGGLPNYGNDGDVWQTGSRFATEIMGTTTDTLATCPAQV